MNGNVFVNRTKGGKDMKKINYLILAFILLMTLCVSSFSFAESRNFTATEEYTETGLENSVDFSIKNGTLSINKAYISDNSILEISPYNQKSILYEGSLSEYKPIQIKNGEYLIAITTFSNDVTKYYHGIMLVSNNEFHLSMDSNEITAIDMLQTQSISPMAAGTLYEIEPNNTMNNAMTIYNDYDVYGRIYDSTDIDWYKVQFSSAGSANFWLGNIPTGEDFDLEVYNSTGTRLGYSNSTSSQELVTLDVTANTWYYIKVFGFGGSWSVSNYLLRAKVHTSYGTMGWQYMYNTSGPFKRISSAYGPRSGGPHCGFDIVSETGTSILGAAISNVYSGTVIQKGYNNTEGYYVRVRTDSVDPNTGNNLVVHYKHLESSSPLTVNTTVSKGANVGSTGDTGESTGPHLHFQVNKIGITSYNYDSTVNPILFFPNVNFSGNTSIYTSSLSNSTKEEIEYTSFYYNILGFVIDYIGIEAFESWIKNVAIASGDVNIRNVLNYFKIDKETFNMIAAKTGEDKIYDSSRIYLDNVELNNEIVIQEFLSEMYYLFEKSNQ